ncbi:hypothetical protein [Effusibacillus consociatus]|uniref:Transposase n=1 Tax=Effusibacillus consociatus TaxID=1117041 RepID=A0ABV9Q1H2_9BACL
MDKSAMDKTIVMDGEKSYEGIVAKKLAGKAAMASESVQLLPMQALNQKAGTWCEARNRGRETDLTGHHSSIRQKPGSHEARRTGVEHTGRPSGTGNEHRLPK